MSWLGAALAIGGTLIGNQARADAAKIQAQLFERQAHGIALDKELEKVTTEKQKKAHIGKQRAAFGKSGVTLEGTPMDVIADTAAEFARADYVADLRARLGMDNARYSGIASQRNASMQNLASLMGLGYELYRRS